MSCENDKKSAVEEEESSGGFFSWFTGGESSSSTSEKISTKCPGGCGMDSWNCNCALKDHLKECCGFGHMPPLITKDNCPIPNPMCADSVSITDRYDDGTTLALDSTLTLKTEEKSPLSSEKPTKISSNCFMPVTDTSGCIPEWICPPAKSSMREYPAPRGVLVLPISIKSRNPSIQMRGAGFSEKFGDCGTSSMTKLEKTAPKNPVCTEKVCKKLSK